MYIAPEASPHPCEGIADAGGGGRAGARGDLLVAARDVAARHASHAPVADLGAALHVGADVAPAAGRLPLVARHGGVRVSHGRVRDGVGAAELVAYLQADADSYLTPDGDGGADSALVPGGLVFRFGPAPPTVRVAEGTAPELLRIALRAERADDAVALEHAAGFLVRVAVEPPVDGVAVAAGGKAPGAERDVAPGDGRMTRETVDRHVDVRIREAVDVERGLSLQIAERPRVHRDRRPPPRGAAVHLPRVRVGRIADRRPVS